MQPARKVIVAGKDSYGEVIMPDGATGPASGFAPVPTLVPHAEPILPEVVAEPATAPAPLSKVAAPAGGRRTGWFIGIGCAVGMAAGVLLTNMVNNWVSYAYFSPVHSNKTSVEVFNELNQMRQEINQLNEEKKLKEQEKDDAVRQALSAVKSVTPPESAKPNAPAAPVMQPGGVAEIRPVNKPRDGFAEVDEEIERLEQTQKAINKILDMFTPPAKDKTKDR
jgi:hypothetical protein